ncbi:polysaccharide deacetylase family protein [Alteromonas sp. ASW11-36]|uniref:Polysaccharide deacetylase family protein n=1 Tax=Alteromonas arenosi TaxID=3055817 RepID=A0ABT7T2R7_9ALTE|nr:polysaccharide deacetylase family protein [Alteromonas sp. ASW11-36]MDM7862049.1 polysaccharide deacetylase family protein [Alteromonas sp. ASW11-36]
MNQKTISHLRRLLCCVVVTLLILPSCTFVQAQERDNAVILVYHHVSTQTPPSTSISPEQFAAHLAHINEHHVVLPLDVLVNSLKTGQVLPDKAIAITFDDGYRNILENAHPLLQQYNMPYTIFINPPEIGVRRDQLTWSEVKRMSQEGVLFANHTMDHAHLLSRKENETEAQWLTRTMQNIRAAEAMITEQLDYSLKYLAYPFGEFNFKLRDALLADGYIGFAQHSGAVSSSSDFGAIPRFPSAGIYANLNTLKTKLNSMALNVSNPSDPMFALGAQPEISLELNQTQPKASQVTCFYRNEVITTTTQGQILSFTVPEPLEAGRSRVNCTAPSTVPGRFHWYSQPFFVADENGHYPD